MVVVSPTKDIISPPSCAIDWPAAIFKCRSACNIRCIRCEQSMKWFTSLFYIREAVASSPTMAISHWFGNGLSGHARTKEVILLCARPIHFLP